MSLNNEKLLGFDAALRAADLPLKTAPPAAESHARERRRAPGSTRTAAAREPLAGLAPIPRIALSRAEAAAALGMSLDSFERHVQHEVRLLRRGSIRLVPVTELARWVSEVAERTL